MTQLKYMQITIDITPRQEKMLKKIYGDRPLGALFQLWFDDWIKKRVKKIYIPTKSLDEQIDELTQ